MTKHSVHNLYFIQEDLFLKKFCVNCNKKQVFFNLNHKLKDGVICDDCILPFGLSHMDLNLLEKASAMNALENRTTDEILGAIKAKNNVFAEIRNEIFNKVPAGVHLSLTVGLVSIAKMCLFMKTRLLY